MKSTCLSFVHQCVQGYGHNQLQKLRTQRNTGQHLKILLILKIHTGLTSSICLRKRWVTFRLTGQTFNTDRHTNFSEGFRARMLGRNYRYYRLLKDYRLLQDSTNLILSKLNPWFMLQRKSLQENSHASYPLTGSTTIPLGWDMSPSNNVFLLWAAFSSLATAIVFLWPSLVQYRLFPIQSTAIPSTLSRSVERESSTKRLILFMFYIYLCSLFIVISMSYF